MNYIVGFYSSNKSELDNLEKELEPDVKQNFQTLFDINKEIPNLQSAYYTYVTNLTLNDYDINKVSDEFKVLKESISKISNADRAYGLGVRGNLNLLKNMDSGKQYLTEFNKPNLDNKI